MKITITNNTSPEPRAVPYDELKPGTAFRFESGFAADTVFIKPRICGTAVAASVLVVCNSHDISVHALASGSAWWMRDELCIPVKVDATFDVQGDA